MTDTFVKNTLLLIAVLFLKTTYAQKTITVNNTLGTVADYTTIQDAVNAASNGDYIYIQPSETAYADATINKTLHIRGRSHSLPKYITELGMLEFNSGCNGSSVEGIRGSISFSEEEDVFIKNVSIKNNYLTQPTLSGNLQDIVFRGNIVVCPSTNRNYFVLGYSKSQRKNINFSNNICIGTIIFEDTNQSEITIANNIFFNNNGGASFGADENESLEISNCIFVTDKDSDREIFIPSENTTSEYIIKNCVTYNYNVNGDFSIILKGSELPSDYIKVIDCAENTNPEFVKLSIESNTYYEYNYLDNFRLKSNAPIKGAGVFGE